ncbi:MAG TPA: TIGR03435 family protein [Bryobacteraceae bacterium]|jgi:uncharacterized protein (TIGR03435 family)
MKSKFTAALFATAGALLAQSFEVATIKPTATDWTGGRYMTMKGGQFAAKNYQIRVLLAAAYNLTPAAISGGPAWLDSDHYDIVAKVPGPTKPTPDEEMSMLQQLIGDRLQLTFHREPKEFPVYALSVARGGPKLRDPGPAPGDPQPLIFTLSPGGARLPARDATMTELAAVMGRTALPRPVLDKTGLMGRYDFDLEWTPDETQFGGAVPPNPESKQPDLFAALQQQLGLRLEASRGTIDTIVIDKIQRPSEN